MLWRTFENIERSAAKHWYFYVAALKTLWQRCKLFNVMLCYCFPTHRHHQRKHKAGKWKRSVKQFARKSNKLESWWGRETAIRSFFHIYASNFLCFSVGRCVRTCFWVFVISEKNFSVHFSFFCLSLLFIFVFVLIVNMNLCCWISGKIHEWKVSRSRSIYRII